MGEVTGDRRRKMRGEETDGAMASGVARMRRRLFGAVDALGCATGAPVAVGALRSRQRYNAAPMAGNDHVQPQKLERQQGDAKCARPGDAEDER